MLMMLSLAACGSEPAEEVIAPNEEAGESVPSAEDTQAYYETDPQTEPEQPEQRPEPEQPTTNSGSGTSTKPKIPQSDKAYLVRINLTHCTVNIYTKDENGEYTVPLKAMICSTGKATPKAGNFYRIGETWEWLRLQGNVYGHYVTQINGNILFHSVPYLRWGDPASLEYWEFDKLGTKASLGCIRLLVSDAIWMYHNAWNIVGVEFYEDEDPGPFGKPTAPKISDNETCRDWDPTDPDPANPWHSYVAEEDVSLPEAEVPAEGEESTEPLEGEQPPVEESPVETPGGEPGEGESTEPPAAETPAEGDVTGEETPESEAADVPAAETEETQQEQPAA